MSTTADAIRDEMLSCVRRGLSLPHRPDPAALWDALDGDGPMALLVMLEYDRAAREIRQERARAWRPEPAIAA